MRHVYALRLREKKGTRPLYSDNKFEGACIDLGAELSVIGLRQYKSYEKETGRKSRPNAHPPTFKSGDGERRSQGLIHIRIPITNGIHICLSVHVVSPDIPLLLGIEVLQDDKLILDFGNQEIRNDKKRMEYPNCLQDGTNISEL